MKIIFVFVLMLVTLSLAVLANSEIFTAQLRVNGTLHYDNASYINNTEARVTVQFDAGVYLYNVTCIDGANNINTSARFFDVIGDTVAPIITLNFPNDTQQFIEGDEILLNFSATDNINQTFTCEVFVDKTSLIINESYLNGTDTFYVSENSIGNKTWSVNCTDPEGNEVASDERSYLVTGFIEMTMTLDDVEIYFNATYRSGDEIKVNSTVLGDGEHFWNVTCIDTFGNRNTTGSKFTMISFAPTITLHTPENTVFFVIPVNNTINFTFSATDDKDEIFTLDLYIDSVLQVSNTTYNNGTNVSYLIERTNSGNFTWFVNATDGDTNIEQSDIRSFEVRLEIQDIFFDGGTNNKYEFRSKPNISTNVSSGGTNDQVCLDFDAPGFGFNFSCGFNRTSFIYNITKLRISNFSHGPSTYTQSDLFGAVNITSDNRTIMQFLNINITSSGTTSNLNISFVGKTKSFLGHLHTIYIEQHEFIESTALTPAANLTYSIAGSKFIFSNLTDLDNTINMTFSLTGFDLDLSNEFKLTELFNATDGGTGVNISLSNGATAPLGVFDNFIANTTGGARWFITIENDGGLSNPINLTYEDDRLKFETIGQVAPEDTTASAFLDYTDEAADLRNSSRINILGDLLQDCAGVCTTEFRMFATDGISRVELGVGASFNNDAPDQYINITLIKIGEKTWQGITNASPSTFVMAASTDISSLDFNKQITIQFFARGTGGTTPGDTEWELDLFELSGVWLNASILNGTYNPSGNITSVVLDVTDKNITAAILTWTEFKPTETDIVGYIAANCNATTPTFEEVVNGISHVFTTLGNEPCVRFKLNSNLNQTSPVVKEYTFEIIKSAADNVSVEVNGISIFTSNFTLNSSSGTIILNATPIAGQLNTIKISSASSGQIMIDQFAVNSSMNPISLNHTDGDDCSNCPINLSFSGDSITVDGLKWEFFGSHNYTLTARYRTDSISRIIQIYYSFFNLTLPGGLEFYDVFATSNNQSNVTPFGQSVTAPIWNVTNLAYDEVIDVYVRTNETIACLNITYTNNSLKHETVTNESFTWLQDTTVFLDNFPIVTNSEVVFKDGGSVFSSDNYTFDYESGAITLTSNLATSQQIGINYTYALHAYDLTVDNTFRLNQSWQKIQTNITLLIKLNFTQTNETINITQTVGGDNSTFLNYSIVVKEEVVVNGTEPFVNLTREQDYIINYSTVKS